MTEEWGPWIEHDGKGCPCVGQIVECRWLNDFGEIEVCRYTGDRVFPAVGSESWRWRFVDGRPVCYCDECNPIIFYRIRKPKGMELLEQALRDVPQREGVEA